MKVDSDIVIYWPQYAEEFYQPMDKIEVPEIPEDDSFKIAFTGNIGTAQGLDILPKAAQLLVDCNVKFVIIGDGRYQEKLKKEIKERGVKEKFILIHRQNANKIPEFLSNCNAAFLSFKNEELWAMTIPAKLQSYMACGMPIIASADGETKQIIEEANCGICCEIGNVEQLAEAIKKLMNFDLTELCENSRAFAQKYFSKRRLMDIMDRYYK